MGGRRSDRRGDSRDRRDDRRSDRQQDDKREKKSKWDRSRSGARKEKEDPKRAEALKLHQQQQEAHQAAVAQKQLEALTTQQTADGQLTPVAAAALAGMSIEQGVQSVEQAQYAMAVQMQMQAQVAHHSYYAPQLPPGPKATAHNWAGLTALSSRMNLKLWSESG